MNRSFSKIRHIQEANSRLEKRILSEKNSKVDEGMWSDMFGKPSVDRATKDSYKSQGHSQRGKEDDDRHFVMFDGEKYYDEDIEYADYHDLGELPRVEDGKLIVTNPAWEM